MKKGKILLTILIKSIGKYTRLTNDTQSFSQKSNHNIKITDTFY